VSAAASNSANGAMLSPRATQIETATGAFVDLLAPEPATLHLGDIARHLSRICRYGGALRDGVEHYSVAEHCVLVHDLLRWQGARSEVLLAALFHDAPEAYLGDMVSPLKYALRAEEFDYPGAIHRASCLDHFRGAYAYLTDRMERALAERFGIWLDAMNSPAMRLADMWALKIEAAALTVSGGAEWRWPGELPNGGALPRGVDWTPGRSATEARHLWGQCVRPLLPAPLLSKGTER
jgi:hypothetical protein